MAKTISREEEKAAREAIAENRKILAEAKKQEKEAYKSFCKELESYTKTIISRCNEDEFADLRKVWFIVDDYQTSTASYYQLCPSLDAGYYGVKANEHSRLWRRDKMFKELESCVVKDGTKVSTRQFNDSHGGSFDAAFDRIFMLSFSFFYRAGNNVKKSIAKAKGLIESEKYFFADENKLLRDLFKKSLKQS